MTAERGLAGLRGTDHIGFTVPNLDEAMDFFVQVLGCEPFFGPGRRLGLARNCCLAYV